MSTATHTGEERSVYLPRRRSADAPPVAQVGARGQLALAGAFTTCVARYLLRVLPQVHRELAHWRGRAAEIPSAALRRSAAEALAKRGNIEGAALFATLAPAARRRATVRALVSFQAAYNYLDALSELPSVNPVANGEQLHSALRAALEPGATHLDYYAHNAERDDGGYLIEILEVCSGALADLPSYDALAANARAAADRIADFQGLNLAEADGGHVGLERWARDATLAGGAPEWWETAAAAGSSLGVHALIGAAAEPNVDAADAGEIDRAYFPSAGGLHSLLDSMVDRREDRDDGRRCLLDYYGSRADAAIQLSRLARRARAAAERLSNPATHRVILTAMCSYYLSAPECETAEAQTITRALCEALGLPLHVAIGMFRARRLLHTATHHPYV